MIRRWPRTLHDEISEMWNYMDDLSQRVLPDPTVFRLPAGEIPLAPSVSRGDLKIDVIEHDGEVTVTADMLPGVTRDGISLELVNPTTLRISCERTDEKTVDLDGYYLRERRFGAVSRHVPLPVPVTDLGASSTFRNGVLEVTLKKSQDAKKARIPIEE